MADQDRLLRCIYYKYALQITSNYNIIRLFDLWGLKTEPISLSMTKCYQDNLLKVNCDKYQAIVLGNPKGERNVDLDICGEKVEQTDRRPC